MHEITGYQIFPIHYVKMWLDYDFVKSFEVETKMILNSEICVSFIPFFHFSFLVFGHFWQQKYCFILHNLCLHFARQDVQDRKKGEKITQLKQKKTQKQKYENLG